MILASSTHVHNIWNEVTHLTYQQDEARFVI